MKCGNTDRVLVYQLNDDNVVSICEKTNLITYGESEQLAKEKGARLMTLDEIHYYLKAKHKLKKVFLKNQWAAIKN